jgi:hypothetical protein
MYLMRIGPAGSERPVVRVDDTRYIDVTGETGRVGRPHRVPDRTIAVGLSPTNRAAQLCTR